MFQNTTHTQSVDAPADAVWSLVAAGDRMDRYLGMIDTCELDGQGAGAGRRCGTAMGDLVERIETVDDETRTFQYSIFELPLPISRVFGTVRVRETGPETSEVTWSSNYEVAEADAAAMDEMVAGSYAEMTSNYERYAQEGTAA